ncbi:MAG TPA: N-acetylmuramoyl-L-alanine amidase [Stellaceae bacterium]|nr:N-acetylmuramoyl-L-alanine amidase [Stellaceae bacterium]
MCGFPLDRRHLLRLGGLALGATLAPWGAALADTRRPLHRAALAPLVMLDPGHGGIDPGCIGSTGIYEKDIALSTAQEFARLLAATGHFRVKLTRTDDEFVPLSERVARARAASADLFLSIHADALPEEHMRGASVFTLSEQASDKQAAALAARENKADVVAGVDLSRHAPDVSDILFDLARRETNNESIKLARDLVSELGQRVRLLNHTHRSAGFAVLKAPDIPSALVEIGCLSNREEEALLQNPAYQRRLAAGLALSVGDFFDHQANT